MTYKLKYKLPGQWFKRTIKRATFNFIENGVWVIICESGEQVCLPLTVSIWVGIDRFNKYKADAEKNTTVSLKADPGGNAR